MNTLTKRIFTIGSILIITLLAVWFIFDRLVANHSALLYSSITRHGGYPHSSGVTGNIGFWVILGGVLLLLLGLGLLQSRQSTGKLTTDTGTSPSVDICPGCSKDVMSNWNLCPYCGYELP